MPATCCTGQTQPACFAPSRLRNAGGLALLQHQHRCASGWSCGSHPGYICRSSTTIGTAVADHACVSAKGVHAPAQLVIVAVECRVAIINHGGADWNCQLLSKVFITGNLDQANSDRRRLDHKIFILWRQCRLHPVHCMPRRKCQAHGSQST